MVDVFAVSSSPSCAVPSMVSAPVGEVLGAGMTGAVDALKRVNLLSASSEKDTFTLMVLPTSAATGV